MKTLRKFLWRLRSLSLCFALVFAMLAPQIIAANEALIHLRSYQQVARDHETKTIILHWSRQIGKSFTLANWAVERLLLHPGRLVTVLSNSKDNGAEFALKCKEVCEKLQEAVAEIESLEFEDLSPTSAGKSADEVYDAMHYEVRVRVMGKVGRIKVLAANPRTARGFSGDLIMDEFAFHENGAAIWEAAEPIISSNPDFLCRISSTGNGTRNMFYQLISDGRYKYIKIRRSDAWKLGELKIYSSIDGKAITPDEARAQAADKRAYDQNYECEFSDEMAALLTQELINAAQREGIPVCKQDWTEEALSIIASAKGDVFFGFDVGRNKDLSVMWVLQKIGTYYRTLAILEMEKMRLPDQRRRMFQVCEMPCFSGGAIDMTGLGLGLFEFAEEEYPGRIEGVNFSSTEPTTKRIQSEGRKAPTARVTEIMATNLLGCFEDKCIEIPQDPEIRDDLRKPEKVTSPGGRVSIAAVADGAGHADRFWALALAVRKAMGGGGSTDIQHVSSGGGMSAAGREQARHIPGRVTF